jgi:diadenosine tetraphosphatase ApaH/serine/threonine PP2A family protein phosphatase
VRSESPADYETPLHLLDNSWITPNDLHLVRTHLPTPEIDLKTWNLVVDGETSAPLKLTLGDIHGFKETTRTVTLECSGNGRVYSERLFQEVEAEFILLGHTHIQMDHLIAGRRFVNPGSVGQPKPRGQMAQYAIWLDGEVHLKSVSYNYQKTQSKIRSLPLEPDVIEELCWILEHGTLDGFRHP